MSEIRDSRPLPKSSITYDYQVCYTSRVIRSSAIIQQRHVVETEIIRPGGRYRAKLTLCGAQAASYSEGTVQEGARNVTCTACKRLYRLIMSVTDRDCPGSARIWGSGDQKPICPVCHMRPKSLSVPMPARKKPGSAGPVWKGRVPVHAPREK